MDVELYSHQEHYDVLQSKRPDYLKGIKQSIDLAVKYSKNVKNPVLADFCCGTGINSLQFSKIKGKLKKNILIDINQGFLEIAKNSKIDTKSIEFYCEDILKVKLKKEADIVFSIFAYHHVSDEQKQSYVNKIKEALKEKGILILTEIFLPNKEICKKYYDKVLSTIPEKNRVAGLKEFLHQTAHSHDFEFKVSKPFADSQFLKSGFKLLEEVKIWPTDNSFDKDVGTFVQVYSLEN